MSLDTLTQEIRTFERSSGFRYGDRTTFSVILADGLMLKGPSPAADYLDSLGLETLPDRVMIVGPGNGGLVTECFRRGTKRVIAFEPRTRFQATLRRVLEFQAQVWELNKVEGLSTVVVTSWEHVRNNTGFKDVDLIIWPEGSDEITEPKETFRTLDSALNPGGKLVVEWRLLGRHKWVEEINAWAPSEHTVLEMAKEIFGTKAVRMEGRGGQTGGIFLMEKPGTEKKAPPKKKETKKKVEQPLETTESASEPEAPREVHIDLAKAEPILILDDEEAAPPPPPEPNKKAKTAKKRKTTRKKRTSKKEPAGPEKGSGV